jgi:hypothetical protein
MWLEVSGFLHIYRRAIDNRNAMRARWRLQLLRNAPAPHVLAQP